MTSSERRDVPPSSFAPIVWDTSKFSMLEVTRIPSRRERRKSGRNFSNQSIKSQTEIDRIGTRLSIVTARYDQEVRQFSGNLTRMTYEGDPFVYEQMEAQRALPDILRKAHFANLETPFTTAERLNNFERVNLFEKRARGLTLFEVEEMVLDDEGKLAPEDIKRIDQLYKLGGFREALGRLPVAFLQEDPETQRDAQEVRQAIFLFVCQKEARPENKITVAASTRPLYDRLRAYFDHYMDLFTNFELGFWEERGLVNSLTSTRAWLPQTLGAYIPARLGITPASAIKLYQSRAVASIMPIISWEAGILPHMEVGAVDAIRNNSLPVDLVPSAKYEPEMDERAAQYLLAHYQNPVGLSTQDMEAVFKENEQVIEKVTGRYAKPLYADIMRANGRRLEFIVGQGPFDKVVVTCQSKSSFIFILKFKDGQTQLTLEVDRDGKVYGMPARLAVGNPYLFCSVFTDTLKPVLEGTRAKHPEVAAANIGAGKADLAKLSQTVVSTPLDSSPVATRLTPKIKTRGKSVLVNQDSAMPASQSDPEEGLKRKVDYTEEQLRRYLPKNVPNEVVEQLMKTLRGFELGRVNLADRIPQAGDDVWEIKSKGLRLLVRHDAGINYALVNAGFRGDDDRVFRRKGK